MKIKRDPSVLVGGQRSGFVVQLSVHFGVHHVDRVDGGREVDEKLADLLQTILFLDFPSLGQRLQEIRLVGGSIESCLQWEA